MSSKGKNGRRVIPGAAAAAVGAVVIGGALTGAWESGGSSARQDAVAAQEGGGASGAGSAPAGDDPVTWKLPIEAYMPTKAETARISSARDGLIDACMAEAGYEAWTPAPDLPDLGGKTLTDWRYGIHDAELAAERGYKPDATEQKAYDEAVEIGAVDESGADDIALRNCSEAADGQAPMVAADGLAQQISGEAFAKSAEDPAVVDAFAKWSSCMASKGYDYKKPMDANDDPRFSDPYNVGTLEIATAKADIECRKRYQVAHTWYRAEVALQQVAIEEHMAELEAIRTDVRSAAAKASTVLKNK